MDSELNNPKPKRSRRLQFSLRTFLIVLTLGCLWLGWQVQKAREQSVAVEAVRKLGGTVMYGYEVDKKGLRIADAAPPGPKWLRDLVGVDFFADVDCVSLMNTPVSDLTPLVGLTNLRLLSLNITKVSDVTPLAQLTSLELLALGNTPVSDLTPLANLTKLEFLRLDYTQVRT